MITWEELTKGRKVIPSMINSAHMLECMNLVQAAFPDAAIVEVDPGRAWQLEHGGILLSRPHNSHYACWAEARELLHESGQ